MLRRSSIPVKNRSENVMSIQKFMGRRPSRRKRVKSSSRIESREPDDASSFFVTTTGTDKPATIVTNLGDTSILDYLQDGIASCIPDKYFEVPVEDDFVDETREPVPLAVFVPKSSTRANASTKLGKNWSLKKTNGLLVRNKQKSSSSSKLTTSVDRNERTNTERRRHSGNLSSYMSHVSCEGTGSNVFNEETFDAISIVQSPRLTRAGSFRRCRSEVVGKPNTELESSLDSRRINGREPAKQTETTWNSCKDDRNDEITQERLEELVRAYLAKIKLEKAKIKLEVANVKVDNTAITSSRDRANSTRLEQPPPLIDEDVVPESLDKTHEVVKARSLPSVATRSFRRVKPTGQLYVI